MVPMLVTENDGNKRHPEGQENPAVVLGGGCRLSWCAPCSRVGRLGTPSPIPRHHHASKIGLTIMGRSRFKPKNLLPIGRDGRQRAPNQLIHFPEKNESHDRHH